MRQKKVSKRIKILLAVLIILASGAAITYYLLGANKELKLSRHIEEARAALADGDIEGIHRATKSVLAVDPNNEEALRILLAACEKNQNFYTASILLKRLISINQIDAELPLQYVTALNNIYDETSFKTVLKELSAQTKSYASFTPEELLELGIAQFGLRNATEAAQILKELNKTPENKLAALDQ